MTQARQPSAVSTPGPGHGAAAGLRVVVLGYLVRGPLGGLAWHHLQYVLGLRRLGCDVYFVEDSDDYPGCYDPSRGVTDTDPSYGLRFAEKVFDRLGLGERWAYHDAHARQWRGPWDRRMERVCEGADVIMNLSGVNPLRRWLQGVPVRILIDTDPVFTQIRHLQDSAARERAAAHNVFLTFGECIGKPGCSIPDDGFPWTPTRQPVVLDAWPVAPPRPAGAYTTVMQWDSYPEGRHEGKRYGMKSAAFEPYVSLPTLTGAPLELAIGSESAPRGRLRKAGWQLRDPLPVTRDPWIYQRYLRGSKAEFSVAKHGYVVTRCGWFSERSSSYLASGRPVVVQDTGFSAWLEAGEGVLAFSSPEQAAEAIEEVNLGYLRHCRAAREVAEAYFASDAVLGGVLEDALHGAAKPDPVGAASTGRASA